MFVFRFTTPVIFSKKITVSVTYFSGQQWLEVTVRFSGTNFMVPDSDFDLFNIRVRKQSQNMFRFKAVIQKYFGENERLPI